MAPPASPEARVRLRTLVLIRWVAITGQLISVLTVHFSLDFPVPLAPVLGVIGLSVLVNLAATALRPASTRLKDRDAALYLGYDVLQLACLLAMTGGLDNPFSPLFLMPVTIAATILGLRATAALCALALACVTVVAFYHWPLPWRGEPFALPQLYMIGLWLGMVLTTVIITIYAWRVAAEARRMADALSATRLALAREHRLSDLGALAAAAAHELGTPLSTIAVVAREIERDLPTDGPLAEDARLLSDQVARCRTILARLAESGTDETAYGRLPFHRAVEGIAAGHEREGIDLTVTAQEPVNTSADEPQCLRRAEIVQGLSNLIDNAVQFAARRVEIVTAWDREQASVEIQDDGPGIAPGILPILGEPYLSTRRAEGRMGLGVFIAKTLLERTGATIAFTNRRGGARVVVAWPRSAIEAEPPHDAGR